MRPLTTSQEDVVRQRVGEALARMGLRFSAHGGQLTGNRVLKQNSHKQYKQLYRQLALFCKRIGDFESLIILDERAPTEFCPSMSADTLMAFIDFKVLPPGTPVVVHRDDAVSSHRVGPVLDYFSRQPILATGAWNDPNSCNQLLSAVSDLHVARHQSGQYSEPCPACIVAYRDNNVSCNFHAGVPRLWRSGCPRSHQNVKNRYTVA
ncbi:Uncharacterized protein PBTT_05723 [Plasmodiophora brassicae]